MKNKYRYRIVYNTMRQLEGVRLPLLLVDGLLEPMCASYILSCYERGDSIGTLGTNLWQILSFYRFCEANSIDFLHRISSLTALSATEIESLTAFCMLKTSKDEKVQGPTYKLRIQFIWKFVFYWFNFYHDRAKTNPQKFNQATETKKMMGLAFKMALKVPGLKGVNEKEGLSLDLRNKFFKIIDPYSEINPWKVQSVKWRNYVLLLLYILTGSRRGEQLLLEITDFELDGVNPSFAIKHRNRPTYPRMMQPAIKTRGRIVALTPELADIVRHYITDWRSQFENADKITFMFLSKRDGGPLSLLTVNKIIETIILTFPEFKGHLSPHRLRNTFHDLLHRKLAELPQSESPLLRQEKNRIIQTYAGGWSQNSSMPEHYTKGDRKRLTNELQREIQQSFNPAVINNFCKRTNP